MNDLFGIQARGGCACAAVYGQLLLSVPDSALNLLKNLVVPDCQTGCCNSDSLVAFKPGFSRISFNYFSDPKEIDFILEALEWVSNNALYLMDYYEFDIRNGIFHFNQDIGGQFQQETHLIKL